MSNEPAWKLQPRNGFDVLAMGSIFLFNPSVSRSSSAKFYFWIGGSCMYPIWGYVKNTLVFLFGGIWSLFGKTVKLDKAGDDESGLFDRHVTM